MAFGQRISHITKEKTGPDDPELLEILEEFLDQVDPDDIVLIADELANRQAHFAELLDSTEPWNRDEIRWVAGAVTPSRKKSLELITALEKLDIAALVADLRGEAKQVPARLASWVGELEGLELRLQLEMATGLLHNADPHRYWLWTRWLWDANTQTGVLPLLVGSTHNLLAEDLDEGYEKVGEATAVSMRFAEGTGLLTEELMAKRGRRLFSADVILACTYCIYLYSITGWRLSREYNRLLPTMPNMMRRLLGLPKEQNELGGSSHTNDNYEIEGAAFNLKVDQNGAKQ